MVEYPIQSTVVLFGLLGKREDSVYNFLMEVM